MPKITTQADLDTSRFDVGIGKMKQGVAGFASGQIRNIGGLIGGAFAVGALISFGEELAREASQIKRTADALGMGVGMLEELGDAAESTGASSEGFQQKIAKLVNSQEEAIKGNKNTTDAFKNLGVSVDDLTSLSPDKLLERIAKGAQSDATAISDLNTIMGKGAASEYFAVLQKIGNEGLPAVDKSVEESINRFAELESKYKRLKDKISEFFMGAVVGIVKFFGGFADESTKDKSDQQNRNFIREKGLQELLAAKRKEDADKLADKELEKAKKIQNEIQKIKEKGDEKRMELLEKREEEIANIRVSPVKAHNAMESIGGSLAQGGMIGGREQQSIERLIKQQEIMTEISKEIEKNGQETVRAIAALTKE